MPFFERVFSGPVCIFKQNLTVLLLLNCFDSFYISPNVYFLIFLLFPITSLFSVVKKILIKNFSNEKLNTYHLMIKSLIRLSVILHTDFKRTLNNLDNIR